MRAVFISIVRETQTVGAAYLPSGDGVIPTAAGALDAVAFIIGRDSEGRATGAGKRGVFVQFLQQIGNFPGTLQLLLLYWLLLLNCYTTRLHQPGGSS